MLKQAAECRFFVGQDLHKREHRRKRIAHRSYKTFALSCVTFCTFLVPSPAQAFQGGAHFNHEESKVGAYTEADPLVFDNGRVVRTPSEWFHVRRPEILNLLRAQMFGYPPKRNLRFIVKERSVDDLAFGGSATREQITLAVAGRTGGPRIHLLLYMPHHAKAPVPVFLGLNYAGNQSVSKDPGIRLGTVWVADPNNRLVLLPQPASESMRGSAASEWPVETILAHGYGFATLYDGDLEPDFDGGKQYGFRALPELAESDVPATERWGAIGVWAWGLSRALDYLGTVPGVDANKVIVIGHSRLGKSALWAGAQDRRFAMVISNESGKGGAALMKRDFGETIEHLNTRFPYWFCTSFRHYSDAPQDLKFDSHFLLSLIAPRPLYIASAAGDYTLDAKGEFLAAVLAEPVYNLLGKQGLMTHEMPPLDLPIFHQIGYHIRPGKHDMTAYDWEQYLTYADLYFADTNRHVR